MTKPVIIPKMERRYVSEDFTYSEWSDIEPLYRELLDRKIKSTEELEQWLADSSEIDRVLEEDYCWRYIYKTCDTEDEKVDLSYSEFVEKIQPHLMKVSNALNKKLAACPFTESLDKDRYHVFLRAVHNSLELYREENIELFTALDKRSKEFLVRTGRMTIQMEGKELTLQQAAKYLEEKNRELRKESFEKSVDRRLEDKEALNTLFDELLGMRHQVALNAGFDNYRDFKLRQLGRFDYGPEECAQFHDAVEYELMPLVNSLMEARKKALDVESLKPYDVRVDVGAEQLPTPFDGMDDLVDKTIECLEAVDPYFAGCLQTMSNMGHLDLESRKGKAPGGYNCPLAETGVPFIFMNAANTAADIRTMIHEGGHAVHSFLMNELPYNFDHRITMEEAELASMSMELFGLEHYEAFYSDPDDRKRAIQGTLENMITLIPWIALIDKFQHWLYTNPGHSAEERNTVWMDMHERFSSPVIDWSGFEEYREFLWQRQGHLFKNPFYYIEYGIAQLGAIGMWRNYRNDSEQALADFKASLSLGATRTLPEMYERAGIPFDFSRDHIRELVDFVKTRLN